MEKHHDPAEAVREHLDLLRRLPSPAMRRALRSEGGFTVTDFAVILGVTRQCVNQWELGVRTPRGEHLSQYVAMLDVVATELRDRPAQAAS